VKITRTERLSRLSYGNLIMSSPVLLRQGALIFNSTRLSNVGPGKALVAFCSASMTFVGAPVVLMRSPPVILLADDDDNDALLLERAFQRAKVAVRFMAVRDGQEAIDYLSGKGKYGDRTNYPWPALMLLDLKMPLLDGFDVLTWWREQGNERDLPIVVMSSSNQQLDVERAMALGAAAYQVKSGDLQNLVSFARELRERWLGRAKKEDVKDVKACLTKCLPTY
jgi:CheY-like chemotaxis protein